MNISLMQRLMNRQIPQMPPTPQMWGKMSVSPEMLKPRPIYNGELGDLPRFSPPDLTPDTLPRRPQGDLTPGNFQERPQADLLPNDELRSRLFETMYVGPNSKTWNDSNEGKFSNLTDRMVRREISDEGAVIDPNWKNIIHDPSRGKLNEDFMRILRANRGKSLAQLKSEGNQDAIAHLLKMDANKAKISDILKHDSLFTEYPDLADLQVHPYSTSHGSFDGEKIGVNPDSNASNESYKSTLLHELQHAIQEKEGWARGGSPDNIIYSGAISGENYKKLWHEKIAELQKLEPSSPNIVRNLKAQDMANMELYQRLAGEVESRDTQARMNMPMDERRSKSPLASQGIPVKDQIVLYKKALSQNAR